MTSFLRQPWLVALVALVVLGFAATACSTDASLTEASTSTETPTVVPAATTEPEPADEDPAPAPSADDGDDPVVGMTEEPTVGFAVTGDDPPVVDGEYTAALERWEAAGITSYVMTYVPVCFCPYTEVTVTIVERGISSIVLAGEGETVTPKEVTIEDLFRVIGTASVDGAHQINVEYHPEEGRPLSIWIDPDSQIADEEFGFEVISFQPIELADEVDRWPEDIAPLCEAFEAIDGIEEPTTATEFREAIAVMSAAVDELVEATPTQLQTGAREMTRFMAAVRDLAEARDWDPDVFDELEESLLEETDIDLLLLFEFVESVEETCAR